MAAQSTVGESSLTGRCKQQRTLKIILRVLALTWLVFLGTIALVSETQFPYWLQKRYSNGWGPYQIGIVIGLFTTITFALSDHRRLLNLFTESSLTFFDEIAIALIIWGFLWQLVWGRPTKLFYLGSIEADWVDLTAIQYLGLVLWVNSGLFGIIRLRMYAHLTSKSPQEPPKRKSLYAVDKALKDIDQDLIGRTAITNRIVTAIRNFQAKTSLVFAVTGDWGIGKTTVLNFVLEKLSEQEPDILPVRLSPWYFSNTEDKGFAGILDEFFRSLDAAIQARFFRPDVTRLIHRYSDALTKAAAATVPKAQPAVSVLETLFQGKSGRLTSIKDNLKRKLQDLPARIVVVIDDIDRLREEEILFVFKLVHLCADFDNIVYILAFDRDCVEQMIDPDGLGYLDKIVQMEFSFPPIFPGMLENQLWQHLQRIISYLDLDPSDVDEFSERWEQVKDPIVQTALTNLRHIKVFVNRYAFALPLIQTTEINPFDLFCIELLRFQYPEIYKDIPSYQKSLVVDEQRHPQEEISDRKERLKAWLKSYQLKLSTDDYHLLAVLFQALFGILIQFEDSDEVKRSRWLLKTGTQEFIDRRLIRHSRYFPRYFFYAVQEGVFLNGTWTQLSSEINQSSLSEMSNLFQHKLAEYRKQDKSRAWLDEMQLFLVPNLLQDKLLMFLKVLIDQYPHLHGPLPTYVSEKQEYELAEQFVRFSIRHLIGTQSHSEILELFHSCQSIGLLPILYDSYQNSLHLASSNPSDDYAAELEEAEQICRKHVERYIKEKRKLFDQPHYWRIHNGLFRFSSNAENYVYYLLDHNPKDLVKLLICFYENKHLDYEGLTSDYEPYKLIEISKKAKQSPIELEGQKQLLGALEKGVDCQQRLDFLPDRIAIYRGHGYKCLKYEGTSRLSNPTDDLVDILRRYNTSDGFDYRRFIERKNFKALLARAEQANVRQELDESDQRLVNKLRQGWKCEQEYRITPHLVKRQGDQFVCYKQAADGNWVAF